MSTDALTAPLEDLEPAAETPDASARKTPRTSEASNCS